MLEILDALYRQSANIKKKVGRKMNKDFNEFRFAGLDYKDQSGVDEDGFKLNPVNWEK